MVQGEETGYGPASVPPVRLAALVAASLAALACGSMSYRVTPARIGALYTSKGDRCGIRFENVTFQEGSSKYENLGLVTLSGTSGDDFTDPMKADVERAACHM